MLPLTQIGYYRPTGYRYETNTAPDGAKTIGIYQYGLLKSVTRKDSANNQLSQVTYTYDPHGRLLTATDARTGATTYGYNNADLIQSVITPAPGTGQPAQTTITYYDGLGQPTGTVDPDGTSLTNVYYPTGQLKYSGGSRTYPVGYAYDAQKRMTFMTNWTGYANQQGQRLTQWIYDDYRGWLVSKLDDQNQGPSYTYKGSGRMETRAWQRLAAGSANRLTASNSYNNFGDLETIAYNDTSASPPTPSVTLGYDRRGRLHSVSRGGITTTVAFNDASLLSGESYSGGTLNGFSVSSTYNSLLQRTQLSATGIPTAVTQTFQYDLASRLTNVVEDAYAVGYSYVANSPWVGQINYKSNTIVRMTTTKQYDNLNRLQSISSAGTAGTPLGFAYQYNDANQRYRVTLADGSYWTYTYDALGQVTSGKKYWQDNTPVPGQQFEYTHDDIGNRTQTKAGGDQNGANMRLSTNGVNTLNQYGNRSVPGTLDIIGIAISTNSVNVNGNNAPYRRGEYFWQPISTNNASNPYWMPVNVISGGTTINSNLFLAKDNEVFVHDEDGNLTSDGRWSYTWDGENRLARMVANTAVGPQQRIDFEYDWQGRRIAKKVWNNTAGSGNPFVSLKFLYDRWNLIAELDGLNNNANVRSYAWGTDLSYQKTGLDIDTSRSGGRMRAWRGNLEWNIPGRYTT